MKDNTKAVIGTHVNRAWRVVAPLAFGAAFATADDALTRGLLLAFATLWLLDRAIALWWLASDEAKAMRRERARIEAQQVTLTGGMLNNAPLTEAEAAELLAFFERVQSRQKGKGAAMN
jgi:hypothetical protein